MEAHATVLEGAVGSLHPFRARVMPEAADDDAPISSLKRKLEPSPSPSPAGSEAGDFDISLVRGSARMGPFL